MVATDISVLERKFNKIKNTLNYFLLTACSEIYALPSQARMRAKRAAAVEMAESLSTHSTDSRLGYLGLRRHSITRVYVAIISIIQKEVRGIFSKRFEQ